MALHRPHLEIVEETVLSNHGMVTVRVARCPCGSFNFNMFEVVNAEPGLHVQCAECDNVFCQGHTHGLSEAPIHGNS